MKKAVYALSGDPVHNGHMESLAEAVNKGMFDEVYFAIGNNPKKKYLFTADERVYLAKKTLFSSGIDQNKVKVESFNGLLRNYAVERGIEYIVRGSRNSEDFIYEMLVADINAEYGLQTVILPAKVGSRNLSSGLVKAIVQENGSVKDFVHPAVKQALEERLRGISLVGVTGNMGAGKSTFCKNLVEYAKEHDVEITHLDFDKMVHSLYFGNMPMHENLRAKMKAAFGEDIFTPEGLNRKKVTEYVLGNAERKSEFTDMLRIPTLVEFEKKTSDMKGIVLVDAAYFTEYNMLSMVNYNAILISCGEDERYARILKRDGMTRQEAKKKTCLQHPQEEKKRIIREKQKQMGHGFFYEVDSSKEIDYNNVVMKLKECFPMFKRPA
jgi:pantetheine-phosphate adenylyltransferase